MVSTLLLLVAAGNALSDRDANAVVMFIQSVITPALFEACKAVEPEKAVEYDNTLMLWSKKHKFTVARGERVARKQAKRDGTDVDLMSKLETEAMVAELRELPKIEQLDRCKNLFEVVHSET